MLRQFFPKLSQNFVELLNDGEEYYDVTIKVGNVKDFRAHKNILCYRSPYFRERLTSSVENHELPDVLPEIFQIILEYIYGGTISLNDHDQYTSDIIKILLAADELGLQELVDDLQKYLIENKSEWTEQHFQLVYRTSSQSESFSKLQDFCATLIAKSPEKISKIDFTSLREKSLIQLIKKDDLQMKEIEVWDHVLEWGLAKHGITSNPNSWSDNDFKTMENTLQHCLPLIRFFSLSSKEFLQKVRPYKKLLKHQLYEDLLNSHLNPDSKPTDDILLPRNIQVVEIIDSKIVNLSIFLTVLRWIDKEMILNTIFNDNFAHIRELNLPYKSELLLRGSRDGFTPKKFHELCDGKHNIVTFMKVKGTEEIIGGYNPLGWKSSINEYGKTKDSFIFSFKNENNFIKDVIISNVENTDYAIYCSPLNGPRFGGGDIQTYASGESTDYNEIYCKKYAYEKKIRDSEDKFSIEDYEVFQIIKR